MLDRFHFEEFFEFFDAECRGGSKRFVVKRVLVFLRRNLRAARHTGVRLRVVCTEVARLLGPRVVLKLHRFRIILWFRGQCSCCRHGTPYIAFALAHRGPGIAPGCRA